MVRGPDYAAQYIRPLLSPGGYKWFRLAVEGGGVWLSEEADHRHVDLHAAADVLREMQERHPLGCLGNFEVLCLAHRIWATDDPTGGTASGITFPTCIALSATPSLALGDLDTHEFCHALARACIDGVEMAGLHAILGEAYGSDDPDSWATASSERLAEYVSCAIWGRDMAPITSRMPQVDDATLAKVRQWALAAVGPTEPAEIAVETIVRMQIGSTTYTVDGDSHAMDVAPLIRESRTCLPARYVAESLGATVSWDEPARRVTIVRGATTVHLTIGLPVALVNGWPKILDTAPFIENNRTYVPVRFIAEALGATVDWDQTTQTVTITLVD